jgi:hypothetical protein
MGRILAAAPQSDNACMSNREKYGCGLLVGGVVGLPTSIIGMLGSIHIRCDDCHDNLTAVSFYTSPWFGRFFFLLGVALVAIVVGFVLLTTRGSLPPGWYPDPGGHPDALRYWDGSVWLEHVTSRRK